MKLVLYAAADLLWATRIKSTADALGLPCRPARTPAMLRDRLADSRVGALLLDLDAPDTAWELLALLRGPDAIKQDSSVQIICWGPHVATDLFNKARELGADAVMTRGAFSSRLPDLLRELSGAGTPG